MFLQGVLIEFGVDFFKYGFVDGVYVVVCVDFVKFAFELFDDVNCGFNFINIKVCIMYVQ